MSTVRTIAFVDAGMVVVADVGYLRRQQSAEVYPDIAVPPGIYKVKVVVEDSWLGRVMAVATLHTRSGFYVGDPCYLFDDKPWQAFLQKTGYLERLSATDSKRVLHLNTGGDGLFHVTVTYRRLTDG